mgnify:CR=1 FL=1
MHERASHGQALFVPKRKIHAHRFGQSRELKLFQRPADAVALALAG